MKEQRKKYLEFGISIFLIYLAIYYWEAFTKIISIAVKAAIPLLIGVAMAYILNILMSFYEKHYFPKSKKAVVQKSAASLYDGGIFNISCCTYICHSVGCSGTGWLH